MVEWGVTDAGYELLEKNTLDKRIEEKWKDLLLSHLPRGAFVEEWEAEDILNKEMPEERRTIIKKYLKENKDYDRNPRDLFMISGTVTDAVLTKEEIDNVQRFGVENLSQLDGLLAAFCLAKESDNPLGSRSYYTWRSKGLRTQIYGHADGDLQIHQINTTPKVNTDLFGKLSQSHLNADYNYWPVLTAVSLKYADTIGIEIPEAKNWQELMRQKGWDGTIKETSGWGVGYDRFVWNYFEEMMAELPDKTNIRQVKKMFFGQMWPNANHEITYLPVIDSDKNLVFFSNSGVGESVELAPQVDVTKFYPCIKIPKQDASHLFKGSVHGIMTHQSRTRPEFLAYMLWQYDQIKAGKTEDEIRKEGHQYGSY